jgi:hypothetical protein
LDHIKKWENKHWLIGFHQKEYIYYHYGSPDMMTDWVNKKAEYIRADFELANIIPEKLTIEDLYKICGIKEIYDYKDAKKIHKNQYRKEEYIKLQDLKNGYSPDKMLFILKDRAKYLMERGSTLNNPHIEFNYFSEWEKITENHANRLIFLVREYFSKNK